MSRYRKMKISDLKPHPKNAEIYGQNENVSDLVEKIRRSGQVHTLVVTSKGIVLAGHRRLKACIELGIQEVDVEIRDFDTIEQEIEYLIDNNATREKTETQKAREARELKKVETILAKQRLSVFGVMGGRGNKKAVPKMAHPLDKSEVPKMARAISDGTNIGKARDIVAEKMNYKSGQEVDRAIQTVDKIDVLNEEGRTEDAELLQDVLDNRSISAAAGLAKHIDNGIKLTEEEKQAIRSGRKSPNSFIKKNENKGEQAETKVKSAETSDNIKNMGDALSAIQKRYQDYLLVFQADIKWLSDKEFYRDDEEISGKTHSDLQNCLEKFKSISDVMQKMSMDEFGCISIEK